MVLIALAVGLPGGSSNSTATHPFLGGRSFAGAGTPAGKIDGACGIAIDSEGDLYVSSPGTSAIDIFDPVHRYLGSIPDAKAPCGLGVDSRGDVYALEAATGEVVKYVPAAYPFKGKPSYSGPSSIDVSGKATGLAVDPSDDQLYVAEGNRIDAYSSSGSLGHDEVQRVYPFEAKGGFFKLSFKGRQTGPIPYDASDAELEAALGRLPTIGSGNAEVSRGPKGMGDHLVKLTGAFDFTREPLLLGDESALRGPPASRLIIETVIPGYSGEFGEGVLKQASGIAAYTGAGSTHYLFAADSAGPGAKIYVFADKSIIAMHLRAVIDGLDTPAGSIGFGAAGAALGVDRKDGHVYVYDAQHEAIEEFDATGSYIGQISDSSFQGSAPGGIAIDRARGGDGVIYVASEAAAGSVLAFGEAPPPRRNSGSAVPHARSLAPG